MDDDNLSASHVGCWRWIDGVVAWDETTRRLFGRPTSPADYAAYLECIHPDDRAAVSANIERFVREGRYDDIEHRVVLSDGGSRWLFARGSAVFAADGSVRGLRGIVIDFTELKQREERLAIEAGTDALTGLLNRRWLAQQGAREVARCDRGAAPFSLVLLDLDDFKRVNDGPSGHDGGDRVLVELAARLLGELRLGDVLVRIGGDELVAFLPQTAADNAAKVARRLADAVAGGPLAGFLLSASIGAATWLPGEEIDLVLRRADRAMYAAKQSKPSRRLAASSAAPRERGGGGEGATVAAGAPGRL